MESSQRVPRKEVVWSRTVTRSSSSFARLLVSSKAGRTLAASPKSACQTSPLLMARIFLLHSVEHHRAFQSGLVTKRNLHIFRRQFGQLATHRPPFGLGQLRQLAQNFSRAHAKNHRQWKMLASPAHRAR